MLSPNRLKTLLKTMKNISMPALPHPHYTLNYDKHIFNLFKNKTIDFKTQSKL